MIYLQFSTERAWSSALIRWFGHGEWSHVDTILPDGRLLGARNDICLGIPSGVQIRPPGYAQFSNALRIALPTEAEQENQYHSWLFAQIGKPYDKLAILGFATGRDWRSDDAWFCDELVIRGLELCKWFPFPLALPPSKNTPNDALLVISARMKIEA